MFERTNIIAGLEIGTSKICVVIGEQRPDGALNVIGVGQAQSNGVRKGEIVSPRQVEEEVREALAEAEQMADVEIRSIILGITGNHLRSQVNRGVHQVVADQQEIGLEDVADVLANARAINLPADHALLHAIRQSYVVDGEEGVTDPVGMHGVRLEVDLHVIHGKATRIQNSVRAVKTTSLVVEDLVFNGIASALVTLTPEEKDLGALVIDLGAGTTDYVVCAEGTIRHSGTLAVGMDHVTNDLAYGLKVSLSRANKLMREHGSAIVVEADYEKIIGVVDEHGLELKRIKTGHLHAIMNARLREVIEIIREDLERLGLGRLLRAGVVLCGGGSRVNNLIPLVEKTLLLDARIAQINNVGGLAQSLNQPEFATAIGLVKFGALRQKQPKPKESWTDKARMTLSGVWVWLLNLFSSR